MRHHESPVSQDSRGFASSPSTLFDEQRISLNALQAADINALFGFRIECIERLGDPHGIWAWTRLNALFNWLPLAACIEDKILCMHGGALPSMMLPYQFAVFRKALISEAVLAC